MIFSKRVLLGVFCAFFVFTLASRIGLAVKAEFWVDDSSSDFKEGRFKNVMLSSRGRLSLGPASEVLMDTRTDISIILDVAVLSDGRFILATGPNGTVFISEGNNKGISFQPLFKTEEPYVCSLAVGRTDKLYIGTGGSKGRIYEYDLGKKEAKVIFEDEDVHYIWDLLILPGGRLLAATGPTGKLIEIGKDGTRLLFRAERQRNLLTLAAGSDGSVYLGTDTDGLVCRIVLKDLAGIATDNSSNREDLKVKSGSDIVKADIIFDAEAPEISDIVVGERYIYVSTAGRRELRGQARAHLVSNSGKPVSSEAQGNTPPDMKANRIEIEEDNIPTDRVSADLDEDLLMKAQVGAEEKPVPTQPYAKVPQRGGAVWRIDKNTGFVEEIFRDKVNIYAMEYDGIYLYLATGPNGVIYRIKPEDEDITIYSRFEVDSILKIEKDRKGDFILATLDPARLIRLKRGELASYGEYISRVFDAKQIARWGRIEVVFGSSFADISPISSSQQASQDRQTKADMVQVDAEQEDKQSQTSKVEEKERHMDFELAVRAGMVSSPEDPGWYEWRFLGPGISAAQIPLPDGRFFQYKLVLRPRDDGTAAVIDKVRIAYMVENLAPKIASLEVIVPFDDEEGKKTSRRLNLPQQAGSAGGRTDEYKVSWKASDPNGDDLRYSIFIKGVDSPYWLELVKSYDKTTFEFDSLSFPDGKYEVKVIASDAASNPLQFALQDERISDVFVIDHTPPSIEGFECKFEDGSIYISARLHDDLSSIKGCWIKINAEEEWRYVAPGDDIYDSKDELIDTVIKLDKGDLPVYVVVFKVLDRAENVSYVRRLIKRD